jgi:purine nucleosidase
VVLAHAEAGQVTFVGWDVSRRFAVMRDDDQAALEALGTVRAHFVNDINAAVARFCRAITGLSGYDLPDPIALAVALRPGLITEAEDAAVEVISNGPGRGTLLVDRRPGARAVPNVRLVTGVDEAGFKDMLRAMCAGGARLDGSRSDPAHHST